LEEGEEKEKYRFSWIIFRSGGEKGPNERISAAREIIARVESRVVGRECSLCSILQSVVVTSECECA